MSFMDVETMRRALHRSSSWIPSRDQADDPTEIHMANGRGK
ncbi:MAG: hypothetical protein VX949_04910 [Planctomycetota bacterium]|nr:hypothetical protein [Planctomycetota bacterium]